MQVLYSALVVLILYTTFRFPDLIASLGSYLHRRMIPKCPATQQNNQHPTETTHIPEQVATADTRRGDEPFSNAVLPNDSTTPNPDNPFRALIIGINDYPNLEPLKGAVADADGVFEFLTTDLQVPQDQIINLRNQGATRAAIIRSLQDLRDDRRIANGDPILIYYAGHGGSGKDPRREQTGGRINEVQVIFPRDYGVRETDSSEPVNYIPDYTIAALLDELAAEKGNNITVIFDSCHSASGSRDGFEISAAMRPRCAPILYSVPADIDAEVVKGAPGRLSKSRAVDPVLCTHQASHILLAACGSREKAWERDQRGQFTTALLKALRTCGVENITYHNLLISLPMLTNQSPHCYGEKKSRILFDSRISSHRSAYTPVTYEQGALVLGAGVASGVTFQSTWELHSSTTNNSPSLGRFIAEMPHISTTVLNPETDEDKQSMESGLNRDSGAQVRLYARQVGAGVGNELKVWFSTQATELLFQGNFWEKPESNKSTRNEVGYVHHSREGADVRVEVDDSNPAPGGRRVAFSFHDPLAERYNISRLDQRIPVHRGQVEAVLFAVAKWNWHLRRTNPQHTDEPSQSMVRIEIGRVGEKIRRNRQHLFPSFEPLPVKCGEGSSIGLVELVARDRDLYGVKLSSKRSVALYTKVFFFDTTDFSIVHLFGHSVSNDRGDPELPASGDLVIGDGGEGGPPLEFTIPLEKKVEVGYLKVFWSTDPLELDDIVQPSAFSRSSSRGVKQTTKGKAMKDWGTVCLALAQCSPSEGE
ncbi:unnamed protein product [Rhizoctonia solani]|uniref:Peptidase C14 caspase domain-containing protein n=1 Tax=Rhizoctonia solani TaxID=456999 RepID=A0A8H3CTJ6_9AGAM|nr:unnamed protein product [Rhizoctonia solani]